MFFFGIVEICLGVFGCIMFNVLFWIEYNIVYFHLLASEGMHINR